MDDLGDRMKLYEKQTTQSVFTPGSFVYARLDGRAFHTFTRGFTRPFDSEFQSAMKNTAKFLVEKSGAFAAFHQSDEISLVWAPTASGNIPFFEGKQFKVSTVLASMATAKFMAECVTSKPELATRAMEKLPNFDCRAFAMPSFDEVVNMFLWRAYDAERNGISAAASSKISHKRLLNVSTAQRLAMLKEAGVEWDQIPDEYKYGSWYVRQRKLIELSSDELEKIPEQHRPTGPVSRTVVSPVVLAARPEFEIIETLLKGSLQ